MFVTGSPANREAERHAITVMNRLAERGHDCHAIYIKGGGEQLDRIRLRDGATVRCLDAARYLDRRALADLAGHIARVRPAVIVAANAYALMYSSLALRLSGLRVPVIVTFHSTALLGAKEWLQMMVYRLFFWMSDCLVFVCEKQRRYWLHRGVVSRRNEVIHNGVDTEEFCDRSTVAQRAAMRSVFAGGDRSHGVGQASRLFRSAGVVPPDHGEGSKGYLVQSDNAFHYLACCVPARDPSIPEQRSRTCLTGGISKGASARCHCDAPGRNLAPNAEIHGRIKNQLFTDSFRDPGIKENT